jgi:hypothetical protein
MSNQTFVKKDRISFAENLNEQEVIAPFSNALYVGPNSGITYDGGSNVVSINYLAGVTLSNQYIYADGTYLSNLPTAITSANLVSTVVGLGTIGYISTATGGGLTQSDLTSSITGLGTVGYISSLSLTSTVTGLGNIYLSTNSVPSTIIGLGTFGYLSSFNSISTNNISAGNLFANIANTSTLSNTDGIFTNSLSTGNLFANVFNGSTINILNGISTTSLNTLLINSSTINNLTNICTTRLFTRILSASDGNYISIGGLGLNTGAGASLGQAGFQFNNIFVSNVFTSNISAGTISTRNLGVSTLFFSVAQGYQISTNRIVGETRTENLYPLASGAIIGYGSNTGQGGFYSEGHFRSTFTQTIQPTLDNNSFSNVVRINGNVSSQNIFVSSIFGTLISTNTLATNNLVGVGFGGAIYSQNFYPTGINVLGFGTGGPGNGPWDSASIRLTQTSSIVTNNISAGVISVSSIRGDGSQLINLNIKITGTLDLSSNEIINVAQTSTISSATTNLCLPTYKFITTTSPTNTYSNFTPFTQLFPYPDYFTHVIPFYNKYRIQLKFSGVLNTLNSLSYFYFELSNNVSPTPVIYQGSIYNATTPYTYNQPLAYNPANVSFEFMDIFDMRANPPNIDDNLYVLLYALNSCNATNYFTDVNCFVITEPVF